MLVIHFKINRELLKISDLWSLVIVLGFELFNVLKLKVQLVGEPDPVLVVDLNGNLLQRLVVRDRAPSDWPPYITPGGWGGAGAAELFVQKVENYRKYVTSRLLKEIFFCLILYFKETLSLENLCPPLS